MVAVLFLLRCPLALGVFLGLLVTEAWVGAREGLASWRPGSPMLEESKVGLCGACVG